MVWACTMVTRWSIREKSRLHEF